MFCSKCGSNINEGAKFCPVCGAPQNSGQNPSIPDSESDTVYFGAGVSGPGQYAPQQSPNEEDTVFMGALPVESDNGSSEEDTVFMGAAPRTDSSVFPHAPASVPASSRTPEHNKRNSYESSNIGISTPKKIIIIAGLIIIAALAVYLVFDFMSA